MHFQSRHISAMRKQCKLYDVDTHSKMFKSRLKPSQSHSPNPVHPITAPRRALLSTLFFLLDAEPSNSTTEDQHTYQCPSPQFYKPHPTAHSDQAPHILPIDQPFPRRSSLTPQSLLALPQSLLTLPGSIKPRSLEFARLPRIGIISVQERLMRVNLLAAARVPGASTLRPRWLLAGRCARVGWQCDTALPARQSGRRDVVAVWAGCALE